MKITMKQALEGLGTVLKLQHERMPIRTAYGLYRLRCELEPIYRFRADKEREFIEAAGAKVAPDGTVDFGTVEKAEEFRKMVAEMDEQETEIRDEKVELTGDIQISVNELMTLDPFLKKEGEQ